MDKLYNNEALLSCSILEMLKHGPMDYARLALCLPLAVDDSIRAVFLECQGNRDEFMTKLRTNSLLLLNRKYLEYQPSILNSLVILSQSGMIDYDRDKLFIDGSHTNMAESEFEFGSVRLHQICESISILIQMFTGLSSQELYSELNVEL